VASGCADGGERLDLRDAAVQIAELETRDHRDFGRR
jgi:hypothetical protein